MDNPQLFLDIALMFMDAQWIIHRYRQIIHGESTHIYGLSPDIPYDFMLIMFRQGVGVAICYTPQNALPTVNDYSITTKTYPEHIKIIQY